MALHPHERQSDDRRHPERTVSTLVNASINLSVRPRSVKSRGDTGASPQRGQNGVVTTALQVGQVYGRTSLIARP
jgi:hypothetical protein